MIWGSGWYLHFLVEKILLHPAGQPNTELGTAASSLGHIFSAALPVM
jgi:hypothetical protein